MTGNGDGTEDATTTAAVNDGETGEGGEMHTMNEEPANEEAGGETGAEGTGDGGNAAVEEGTPDAEGAVNEEGAENGSGSGTADGTGAGVEADGTIGGADGAGAESSTGAGTETGGKGDDTGAGAGPEATAETGTVAATGAATGTVDRNLNILAQGYIKQIATDTEPLKNLIVLKPTVDGFYRNSEQSFKHLVEKTNHFINKTSSKYGRTSSTIVVGYSSFINETMSKNACKGISYENDLNEYNQTQLANVGKCADTILTELIYRNMTQESNKLVKFTDPLMTRINELIRVADIVEVS